MSATEQILIQAFARIDKMALGVAAGLVGALLVCLCTIVVLVKGAEAVRPILALLEQFFIGYTVSWKGSIVGASYGFVAGFALGWTTAFLRNLFMAVYLYSVKLKASLT